MIVRSGVQDDWMIKYRKQDRNTGRLTHEQPSLFHNAPKSSRQNENHIDLSHWKRPNPLKLPICLLSWFTLAGLAKFVTTPASLKRKLRKE